jgi:hypothetical protein
MRHRKLRHRQGCRGRSARLGKCSSWGERIASNDSPIARPLIWGVFSASPGNARRSWRMPPGRGPRHEALRTLHAFGWASQRIPAPESTANDLLLTSEYALQFHFPNELGMEPAVGVEPEQTQVLGSSDRHLPGKQKVLPHIALARMDSLQSLP